MLILHQALDKQMAISASLMYSKIKSCNSWDVVTFLQILVNGLLLKGRAHVATALIFIVF